MDGNAFLQSLQQLGQYLNQQNQGTGSGGIGLSSGYPAGNAGSNPGNISKVVTQVHYAQPEASTDMGAPAVTANPPAPQVSNFAPPGGGNTAVQQPNAVTPQGGGGGGGGGRMGGGGGQPGVTSFDSSMPDDYAGADVAGMGGAGGAGSGQPTSNAISGITSALSKGLTNAASAIGGVKTMPEPINMGAVPGINQVAPTLIGRRTQQNPYGY